MFRALVIFFSPRSAPPPTQDNEGHTMPATLTATLERLVESVDGLHRKFDAMESRVKKVEDQVREVLPRLDTQAKEPEQLKEVTAHQSGDQAIIKTAQGTFTSFQEVAARTIYDLQKEVEALDNKSRAAVIRVLGVDAVVSTEKLQEKISELFQEIMKSETSADVPGIVKVFCLPSSPKKGANQGGGTVMVTLQNATQREELLRAAAKQKVCNQEGRHILLFPDMHYATAALRRGLMDVRKRLLDRGIQASVQFPSRLRVQHNKRQFYFTDVEEAEKFLKSLGSVGAEGNMGDETQGIVDL